MKYVYLQDNSTPDKVVRRLKVETQLEKFKYQKMKQAQIIGKDEVTNKIGFLGMKWTQVTKEDYIESAIRGIAYAKNNYQDIKTEFDLKYYVKRLAKKTGLTQKEIEERMQKYDILEVEILE